MAKIYLIRHCESEGNACRRSQANTDALVTTKGFEQNEMLRRRFKGIHIDALYSSDSYRSIMTIDPIAKERGLTIHVRQSLREITTGIWEDMAWGNIAKEYPEDNRVFRETPWAMTTPGASSFQQVADRLIYSIRQIAKEIGEDGVALAVSHSCSIKSALCLILGKPISKVNEFAHGDNTAVSLLDIDKYGNIKVEFMNDDSHLDKRLKRAWGGVAGEDINMQVYPCCLPKQKDELIALAKQDAIERKIDFNEDIFYKDACKRLLDDPDSIALCYLKGKTSGYIRYGLNENLPKDCALIENMYVIPELQGKGYCEQLFGYAAHQLRYHDMNWIAIRKNNTKEEQRVIERFVFSNMKGHPEYYALYLYCPPCPYPVLA